MAKIRVVHQGDSYLHSYVASVLIGDYLQHVGQEPYDSLTNREREVLKLVAEGRSSRETADRLCVSIKTVLGHRTKIMEKWISIIALSWSNMPSAKG